MADLSTVIRQAIDWTHLGEDPADVNLSCNAHNGHPDLAVLGRLDSVQHIPRIAGRQRRKQNQHLQHAAYAVATFHREPSLFQDLISVTLTNAQTALHVKALR